LDVILEIVRLPALPADSAWPAAAGASFQYFQNTITLISDQAIATLNSFFSGPGFVSRYSMKRRRGGKSLIWLKRG
jgi:hypothetical protein